MTEKDANKHYNVKPLHVSLRPSRLLAMLLGFATVGSIFLVMLLPLPLWLRLPLALMTICATLYPILRDALLRLPRSIMALEVSVSSQLRCMVRSGDWHEVQVLGSSYVTPWLTVLNLKVEGSRLVRHVVLLPDTAEEAMLRRLRVWLKWGCEA